MNFGGCRNVSRGKSALRIKTYRPRNVGGLFVHSSSVRIDTLSLDGVTARGSKSPFKGVFSAQDSQPSGHGFA